MWLWLCDFLDLAEGFDLCWVRRGLWGKAIDQPSIGLGAREVIDRSKHHQRHQDH
jgi:hypothetical protein